MRRLIVDAGDHVLAPQHADAMGRPGKAHLEARVAREEHLVAGLDRGHVRPDRGDDALRHCAASFAGTISPLGSSDSSTGSRTMWSSSGSSVTSVIGCPSSMCSTILAACASAATTSRSRTRTSPSSRARTDEGRPRLVLPRGRGLALPHLRRRPFHMKRFPNGVDADFFHQKRVPANHPDYVDEVFVQFPSGHSTVFAIVDNEAALAWVANLGCIELHTWHSRVPEIERPDYLLIDLDPTTDGQWPFVREIALVVKEVIDELGLRSYPKTSGATGLHILAPIRTELRFPDVRRLAKALAEEVERRVDDQAMATTTWKSRTALASSSTSAKMHATARSPRRTPCARHRTRESRRRSGLGRGRGRRAGGVYAGDDAGADRRGR